MLSASSCAVRRWGSAAAVARRGGGAALLRRDYSRSSAPRLASSSSSSSSPPFDKVLIANRGEIACRVIRTCKRMGVRTVALYSDADGPDSLHASMADECYRIGVGPSPGESYLRGEEVLDVALRSSARAVHPGYGFLSENPTFAALCAETRSDSSSDGGVTFVGPPPSAIEAMGSKSKSKSIMEEAGVPCTPGYHGDDQDPERLLHEAVHTVGFPCLIKAVMGGGGKGMRLVHSESEFLEKLESCKRESRASFGDDRVILERYLVNPRHVEVQVVADAHGNAVHLHERDCSLQRRHQKIIEEAPASDLPEELRREMGEMAVRAAKAVGYVNAGTVEFLLDGSSSSPNGGAASKGGGGGGYYFCEMNTRLQVEHPITELITGVDLVEWQLRVASGEVLPVTNQDDVPCYGHAMEARIYAENPARDFLPAAGRVWHHDPSVPPNVGARREPPAFDEDDDGSITGASSGSSSTAVRVDTGVKAGRDVTVHYDPMISKLIVHSPSRSEALTALVRSLKRYRIAGLPTNIPFLIDCASHPAFGVAGGIDTGFLDRHGDELISEEAGADPNGESRNGLERSISALAVSLLLENRAGLRGGLEEAKHSGGPWSRLSGSWRMGGEGGRFRRTLRSLLDDDADDGDEALPAVECVSNRDGSFEITVPSQCGGDRQVFTLDGRVDASGRMDVIVDGTRHLSFAVATRENADEGSIEVCVWSRGGAEEDDVSYAWRSAFRHPLPSGASASSSHHSSSSSAGSGAVRAPMPGKITRVNFSPGDSVKSGEVVLVMEAMKMEHSIRAPRDGTVGEVRCEEGDVVEDGAVLAEVLIQKEEEATTAKGSEDEEQDDEGAERTAM